MKVNASKSKVMVIGKRLDKNKEWKLGNSMLIETNDYKYLGVYFSRSLSFSYHINCYLKKNKFERKFNYMIKLLGEHGTFNRISFGDALWNSILRPSISHGCAVWIPSALSSKGMLETWQYKAAKLIINTNMTIPWESIKDFLDRQRISYFSICTKQRNYQC